MADRYFDYTEHEKMKSKIRSADTARDRVIAQFHRLCWVSSVAEMQASAKQLILTDDFAWSLPHTRNALAHNTEGCAALGLVDFEKNVVVAMIGQAIAPRSIGIMGGGGGGGGPSKTMQVEVLLRAFSHTLQQQIRNRRFFYKSAVLVREGTRLGCSGRRTAHVSSPHPAPPATTGARGDPGPPWRRVGRRPHADLGRGRPPDA